MTGPGQKLTIDLEGLSRLKTFVVTTDAREIVTWASAAVRRRLPDIVGKPADRILTVRDRDGGAPQRGHDDSHLLRLQLVTDKGAVPLQGRWLKTDSGRILLANPEVSGMDDLKLFKLVDFPEDDVTVEMLATREEYNHSLQEANSITKTVSRQNEALVVSRENLEKTVAKLETEFEERRRAESDLKRLRTAIDTVTECVVGIDTDCNLFYFNMSFGFKYGLSVNHDMGQPITNLLGDSEMLQEALKQANENTFWDGEIPLSCFNSQFPAWLRITQFTNDQLNSQGYMLIFTDLTDIKQEEKVKAKMEADLLQAQKLESVGQLAAGIAHEINTPIQFVSDNLRFLRDAMADIFTLTEHHRALLQAAREGSVSPELVAGQDEAIEESDLDYLQEEIPSAIAQSLDGVDRVAKIVRAMKQFSHPGTLEKSLSDINEAITTTITIARNEWKYAADLETDFDPELPPLPCLLGEFNQVVLNLIVNARDAIVEKSGDKDAKTGRITISTKLAGQWAEIRVSDTGSGMPEQVKSRIFDPFFTTKEVGKGTGQGLAIAHNVIVDKHGGMIDVETTPGEGTTFIIKLPLEDSGAEGAKDNEGDHARPETVTAGRERAS